MGRVLVCQLASKAETQKWSDSEQPQDHAQQEYERDAKRHHSPRGGDGHDPRVTFGAIEPVADRRACLETLPALSGVALFAWRDLRAWISGR